MAKYIVCVTYGDLEKRKKVIEMIDDEFMKKKYDDWIQKVASKIVASYVPKVAQGRNLSLIDGRAKPGPYVETNDSLLRVYIIDVDSWDDALVFAGGCPTLLYHSGSVEVRELE